MKGPTPTSPAKYVAKCLRLKSYSTLPGRWPPAGAPIPAAALLWALLMGTCAAPHGLRRD